MTYQDLGPTRRREARQFLDTVLSRDDFNRDQLLHGLHALLTGRVPVIAAAANELRKWNESSEEGRFDFIGDTNYDSLVEVVLDAAALYRGATTKEAPTDNSEPPDYTEDRVLATLNNIVLFLRSIAAGRVNERLAESHASQLMYITSWLREVKFSKPVTS